MVAIILPKDSGVLGKGVFGDLTLGLDYTPIEDLTEIYDPHANTPIEIYTPAFILCGIVDNYESFTYTQNWYDFDTFEIDINHYKANVEQFVDGDFIRYSDTCGEHIGVIESIEKPLDADGKGGETWKISGRGAEAIFAQRICMAGTGCTAVTGITFTFAATTTVTASASCLTHGVAVGQYIFNSTNDANTYALKITAISSDGLTITLDSAYAGTTGSGKTGSVGTGYNACGNTAISTLTFTFAATQTVTVSASCLSQIAVGYYIYNSTNDDSTKAVKITAISTDGLTITLNAAYAGTAGSGKAASLVGLPAESALRHYVDGECISYTADTNRNIPGLALATDQKRGAIVARSTRYDLLSDILYGIAQEAEISFRLIHGTGLNFTFTVEVGSDVSGTVTITPDYGNVATFKYVESLLEMKNFLYVGGSGDGPARLMGACYDTTEPSGWNRREKFVDASDCTTSALLDARGAETLATTSQSLSLEAEYLPSPTYTLGVQFKLGDTINILWPNTVTMISRITSITTTLDNDGKTIKLGLGKDAPDLVSILKLYRKLNTAQSRR